MPPEPHQDARQAEESGARGPAPQARSVGIWVRNVDAGELFDAFLVAAVATILSIRLLLSAIGYPQLGGARLHIAHMLWGGLLMTVALGLVLGFLGHGVRRAAALLGGVGFGLFIDELGKFLTRDSNYFFRPAIALIYVVFVGLYLAFRAVRGRSLTRLEALANALEITQEAVRHDLDREEKQRALELLRLGERADPVVTALDRALSDIAALEPPPPSFLARLRNRLQSAYLRLIRRPWFPALLVALFVGHSLVTLIQGMVVVPRLAAVTLLSGVVVLGAAATVPAYRLRGPRRALLPAAVLIGGVLLLLRALRSGMTLPRLSFLDWAELVSTVVPAAMVAAGAVVVWRSRLRAYHIFRRAVLLLIFVTQVFAFYRLQLLAVLGLFLNILVLVTLRYLIHQEEGLYPVSS